MSILFDALIVGGGPAGATTALLLSQAGWSVALVEKKIFPRRKVCGEFISATSLPLLHKLGISNFYLNHCGPEIKRVGFFSGNNILTSAMPSTTFSLGHWGHALGREHLDTILLENARQAGATLYQPWEFKSLDHTNSIYTATITSPSEIKSISAKLIIMANGSWEKNINSSPTRPHNPSDLLAFKAHFKKTELSPDLMPLIAFPGGYGGLVHTDNNRITLSCCIRRDKLKFIRQQHPGLTASESVLHHIQQSTLGVSQVLCNAKREDQWLAAGPIQPGIHHRYKNNIFYVGNIAGEAHPVVAEGISMAMQSAWLLSEVLVIHRQEVLSGKNKDLIGQEYTKLWNTHFANRIHMAALFAHFAMRSWAVSIILPFMKAFPSILTYGAKLSGKINQVVPTVISTSSSH